MFATAFDGYMLSLTTSSNCTARRGVITDDVSYADDPFFQRGPMAPQSPMSPPTASSIAAAGNANYILNGHDIGSYDAAAFRPTACPTGIPKRPRDLP